MQFTGSTFGRYASRWLIITGVFELILAAIFVFVAIAIPEARASMLVTGAILGFVGVGLVASAMAIRGRAQRTERIEMTGVPAQGTITGLTQTGMFLNDNPQVEMDLMVQVPGRAPYPASRKEFVPLILLPRLTTGAVLPVHVDQTDPSAVVVDWDSLPTAGAPVQPPASAAWPGQTPPIGQPAGATTPDWESVFAPVAGAAAAAAAASAGASGSQPPPAVSPGTRDETLQQVQQALQSSGVQAAQPYAMSEQGNYTVEQLREFLRTYGVDGTARIDMVQDTGKDVGDDHMVVMQATITVPGQPPHQTQPAVAMIPKDKVSKLTLGTVLPCKVAPNNPDAVTILWERLV
jgi:hypothetical protein